MTGDCHAGIRGSRGLQRPRLPAQIVWIFVTWWRAKELRPPHAYELSTTKLAHVLAAPGTGGVTDEHFAAGDAVAEALDAAWTLEGGALEEVVDCYAALG